jgi:chromosome segregation ATPase
MVEWLRRSAQPQTVDATVDDVSEKVFSFRRHPFAPRTKESAVLELVNRVGDIIRGIENRQNEIEASAQRIARDAAEKLQLAENRARAADVVINEANLRVHAVEHCLQQAQDRIAAVEAQLAAAEQRVKAAEMRAVESDDALATVEDAIRTHLLGGGTRKRSSILATAA